MDTVVVFTGKNLETMFSEGGSGYWKANTNSLAKCKYIVTVANARSDKFDKLSVENHSHAFMIGKIAGTLKVEDRLVIQFSEYATIDIPNAWSGQRNPVRYTDIGEFPIQTDSLNWQPFPKNKIAEVDNIKPLTIDEAKKGIAKMMGIATSCIEIIVRA